MSPRGTPCRHDPRAAARAVNLRYVTGTEPGIARARRGSGFVYLRPDGRPVRDARTLERIKRLVIPPAWREVWICADPRGHIQATGRDEAGRKQYRYHDRWSEVSAQTKYDHVLDFAAVLPKLRAAVDRDMRRPGLDAQRVVAGMVRLMDVTLIRVGNDAYERVNGSYGLTTLHDKHVRFRDGRAVLSFNGKSGQHQERAVAERRLVRLMHECHDLAGCRLFQYLGPDGKRRSVYSGDINDYIRGVTERDDLGAKDFRTWGGTVWAAVILGAMGPAGSETTCKRNICAAIKEVAGHLGNRPAVCRKYYIHPAVIGAYRLRRLTEVMARGAGRVTAPRTGLSPEERAVRKLLEETCKDGRCVAAAVTGPRSPSRTC